MSITFDCTGCGKQIEAPDSAGGKRGKCPFCGQGNDIPAAAPAPDDDDLFDLAPLDHEEERRRKAEVQRLLEQERDLLAASAEEAGPPLEQRDSVDTQDLYHFVINYCRDMADGQLERAQTHLQKLKNFRALGKEATEDFLT
ncbi:MAG: TFIIB-type zinc ribbon-containing protein, partial [Planctomycetota bacterium]